MDILSRLSTSASEDYVVKTVQRLSKTREHRASGSPSRMLLLLLADAVAVRFMSRYAGSVWQFLPCKACLMY